MKQILHFIVSSIVDNPEKVVVEEAEENGFVRLQLSVAKDDMGKVIGKEGKVIRAVRNVMKLPAIKQGKKVEVSLSEQEE